MSITDQIFKAFLNCRYKAYLKSININGEIHILQKSVDIEYMQHLKEYQNYLVKNRRSLIIFNNDSFNESADHEYSFNVHLMRNNYQTLLSVRQVKEKEELKFVPILVIPDNKINNTHKLLLAYQVFVAQYSVKMAGWGEIIYSKKYKKQKLLYKKILHQIEGIINELKYIIEDSDKYFLLNKHCKICEYNKSCSEKALKSDHLSLLPILKEKDINELNAKGIFTLKQLSYTFKPRRAPKRLRSRIEKHYPALKALSIRKGVIYIYGGDIELSTSITKIYFDVEGQNGDNGNFYYLVGIVIEKGREITEKSFWVSSTEESIEMYEAFLKYLSEYVQGDFILFHYGTYDLDFLNSLENSITNENLKLVIQTIISRSKNILPFFLYMIYCPILSNDLKSLSKYLGFVWSEDGASGLEAIAWRKAWEKSANDSWKDKLIRYNLEDCLALKVVVDFIYSIIEEKKDNRFSNLKVSRDFTEEIQQRYGGKKFGNANFILPDYHYINKKAYFDYQKNKVFIRINRLPQNVKNNTKPRYFSNRINQSIILKNLQNCIFCGYNRTNITTQIVNRTIIDLKITKNGLKKWVTKYVAHKIYCPRCKKHFNPKEYKEIGKMYGHNLISWVMYQYIANNTSFEKIEKTLEDCFQISVGEIGSLSIQRFKEIAAEYYKDGFEHLKRSIKNWHIIHADETQFRLKSSNGYIWVLTNLETVVFMYRPDRTCHFLSKIIEGFKGVFISDFYKGYDSIDCIQQKCLIHLLRDVNDLLYKEQQNNELNLIGNAFTELLRKIVSAIDKYGLKRRNLYKYSKDVDLFYSKISIVQYKTKNGKSLFERFCKSRKNLFSFLRYDNVPWNNNNAEHSFKHFAIYRRQTNGLFTGKSIEDYLILLSFYQTCKYRNINFMNFLLSKEHNIDEYFIKHTSKGKKKLM